MRHTCCHSLIISWGIELAWDGEVGWGADDHSLDQVELVQHLLLNMSDNNIHSVCQSKWTCFSICGENYIIKCGPYSQFTVPGRKTFCAVNGRDTYILVIKSQHGSHQIIFPMDWPPLGVFIPQEGVYTRALTSRPMILACLFYSQDK